MNEFKVKCKVKLTTQFKRKFKDDISWKKHIEKVGDKIGVVVNVSYHKINDVTIVQVQWPNVDKTIWVYDSKNLKIVY